MKNIRSSVCGALLLLTLGTSHAQNLVVNGSLFGNVAWGGLPFGWTAPDSYGDTASVGAAFPWDAVFGFAWQTPPSASLDGGSFVGMFSEAKLQQAQGISLTGGTTYALSFEYATWGIVNALGYGDYLDPGAITVSTVAGQFTAVATPARAAGSGWTTFSTTFTPSTTQTYQFQFTNNTPYSLFPPTGSYVGIDGISITALAAVPEPATGVLLLGGGALALGMAKRKRTRSTTVRQGGSSL